MKKSLSIIFMLLLACLQGFSQHYINIYQGSNIIKQFTTDQIDSISVSQDEPRIISLWHQNEVVQTYSSDEIDYIRLWRYGVLPFSYLGVVGFNDQIYKKDIGIITKSTSTDYKNFVNNLSTRSGTLLYNAVDNAMDMLKASNITTPLQSVNLVTFTDGLDQGSIMVTDNYDSSAEYLAAMKGRIANETVSSLPVTAYTLGIRGSDVTNTAQFNKNLQDLASSADNATEVTSFSSVKTQLQNIANQITNASARKTMSIKIPGAETGTKVRFVFDNKDANSSYSYIEGTINLKENLLYDVTYHGLTSLSGSTVQGTRDGIYLKFTFTGLQSKGGVSLSSYPSQYSLSPYSASWQINSETSSSTLSKESHNGTLIVLALDCSSSLGSTQFSNMQTYAKEFIDMIASNAESIDGLSTPTSFEATCSDDGKSVNLSWIGVKNAQYYSLYRSNSADGTYNLLADNLIETSFIDNNPLEGLNYYRLYAKMGNTSSDYAQTFITFVKMTYVDLGLPSGTLWADHNVGANRPEEYGYYFAWGETETKSDYYYSTYKYGNAYKQLTKYCTDSEYGKNGFTDNKTELDLDDDVAHKLWGSSWRIPSNEQFKELIDNTTSKLTEKNNVLGWLFTAKNGNSIFLPAAGYRFGSSLYGAGSHGYYWSRTLNADYPSNAYGLFFYSGGLNVSSICDRSDGRTVRPVRPKN